MNSLIKNLCRMLHLQTDCLKRSLYAWAGELAGSLSAFYSGMLLRLFSGFRQISYIINVWR